MGNQPPRFGANLKKRLLFTGGGGAGSEALNRLLQPHYEVHFADADIEAKPFSLTAQQWHEIPFASDPKFIEVLNRLCRKLEIDLLIPGVDEELLPISQARAEIGCEVLLPSIDFVKTHLDKLTSNLFLHNQDLPAPQTESLLERKQIAFPCIAKPRHGRGSRGVAVVHSEQELQAHVLLSKYSPEDFVVQELLIGQEFTVMMAADAHGRLRAVVPVRVGIKRGITLRAATVSDEQVIAACEAIHAASPVAGCYNIQLIKTEDGNVKPFEINPRISTTACLAFAAGVDFIGVFFGEMPHLELLPFRNELQLRRSWHNEFIER